MTRKSGTQEIFSKWDDSCHIWWFHSTFDFDFLSFFQFRHWVKWPSWQCATQRWGILDHKHKSQILVSNDPRTFLWRHRLQFRCCGISLPLLTRVGSRWYPMLWDNRLLIIFGLICVKVWFKWVSSDVVRKSLDNFCCEICDVVKCTLIYWVIQ